MSNPEDAQASRVAEQLLRELHPTSLKTDGVLALASKIQLLLMDVDGVLTNGKLYNVPNAEGKLVESKGFDSQDGIGLQWLNWKGIKTGVISGRLSPISRTCRRNTSTSIERLPSLRRNEAT